MEDHAKEMSEFQVDKYFDAIKQVGTANSAGLFGGVVALYYFRDRVGPIVYNIKFATGTYLLGVIVFAVAYGAFIAFVHRHQSKIELPTELKDLFRAEPVFNFAIYAAIWSFGAWFAATCLAAYVLYLL